MPTAAGHATRTLVRLGGVLAAAAVMLGGPVVALAHGLSPAYQSPLPLAVYLVGAASTVALSFVFVLARDMRAAPAAPAEPAEPATPAESKPAKPVAPAEPAASAEPAAPAAPAKPAEPAAPVGRSTAVAIDCSAVDMAASCASRRET